MGSYLDSYMQLFAQNTVSVYVEQFGEFPISTKMFHPCRQPLSPTMI